MPIFYRGAGVGTYWHENDARLTGFTPQWPGAGRGVTRILHHVARGSTVSPYVSLSRSYGIARDYALAGPKLPTFSQPAFVYEIQVDSGDGYGAQLVDPVAEIARDLGPPDDPRSYHHDGDMKFLLGIVDSRGNEGHLNQSVQFPPPGQGTPRQPLLHIELEAMVRALRDADVLAFGTIAAAQVRRRIDVY